MSRFMLHAIFALCLIHITVARPSQNDVFGKCVSSCDGVTSGIHQSCFSCEEYLLCIHNNATYVDCEPGKIYDDTFQSCIWWSSTCGVEVNNGVCVSTCLGVANGNYQSCRSCGVYVACWDNMRTDDLPCPGGSFWDDTEKNCIAESTTCTS